MHITHTANVNASKDHEQNMYELRKLNEITSRIQSAKLVAL